MMVKICGITRREDALMAVEAGASALGFIFFPKSPRYVTPSAAAALVEGINILKVGVFVDESSAAIEAVMREANLDVAQVYGSAIPNNTRLWQAFRPAELTAPADQHRRPLPDGRGSVRSEAGGLEPNPDCQGGDMLTLWLDSPTERAEAILLDGPANGISFDWKIALNSAHKVIVAGGLDASNVAEAIRIARPWGVDASSKLESAPGIKNHQKVRAFIKAAQEAK